mgnify:CR=1 FL=1
MKRRSKQRMTAIHVSIPVRLLEDFDETLGFTQSRSAKIASLIQDYMDGDGDYIHEAPTRQLIRAICNRDDCDATLRVLLEQVLTSSSSNAEHDA